MEQMRELPLSPILDDPETSQTMGAEIMREMFRRRYENVQQSFLNATTLTGDNRSDLESGLLEDPFGCEAGPKNMINSPAPNTNPLPNPLASADTGGTQTKSGAWNWGNPTQTNSGFPDLGRTLGSMPYRAAFKRHSRQNPAISQMTRNVLSNPQYPNEQLLNFRRALPPQIRPLTSRELAENDGGPDISTSECSKWAQAGL